MSNDSSDNNVDIVQLTPDDWQAYRTIRLEALQTEPQAFGSTYAANVKHPESLWRDRLEAAADGRNWILLFAKHSDDLVGMIGAFVADESEVADIIAVYVTPAFRRQGIAHKLMSALMHEIEMNSAIKLARLGVSVDQQAAVRLYEGFGFHAVGTESGVMGDGQVHNGFVMENTLHRKS